MSKHTALRILIVTVFAAVIIGTVHDEANASASKTSLAGTCRYVTYVNAYASAGEEIDLNEVLSSDEWFPIHRCRIDGMRLEMSKANTPDEVKHLQAFVDHKPGDSFMFCRTGKTEGYMLNLAWLTNRFNETKYEQATWPAWSKNYAAANGCHF